MWIWEQTAIISLYNNNWLVCITETESVYCAVRTGSSSIIQVMCFVWIWEQTAIISLYSINWLVCITETDSVYCAVRTGSLYIVRCHSCVSSCYVRKATAASSPQLCRPYRSTSHMHNLQLSPLHTHPIIYHKTSLTFWRRNYFFLILAHLYIKCE